MRNFAASEIMSSRWNVVKLSGTRMRPLPGSRLSFAMALSMSAGLFTSEIIGRTVKKSSLTWHGIRIVHDGNAGELRHHLFQQREIFADDAGVKKGETGDVAAWSRHARDKPAADWIGHGDEHNRNCPSRSRQCSGYGGAVAENAIGVKLGQLFRVCLHAARVILGKAIPNSKILLKGPALPFKALLQSLGASPRFRIVCEAHQRPDGAYANRLLRLRRDYPAGQHTAEKSNNFASSDVGCHLPSPQLRFRLPTTIHCPYRKASAAFCRPRQTREEPRRMKFLPRADAASMVWSRISMRPPQRALGLKRLIE